MYIPKPYREDDTATLVEFMRANSFATLVSTLDGQLWASHVPLVVAVQDGVVTLSGHLAKPNPHWHGFDAAESLVIFSGPHAYVSPSLYEKRESVPTWNYIAVHAYGVPRAVRYDQAPERVQAMLEGMIDQYDAAYQAQWQSLSDKFRHGMMSGVVGFEIAVTRLEGKYKLSQNRSEADQQHVAHAMLHSVDPAAQGVGEAMQQRQQG
ncbi:MAG: FMN-binding negative transcriptional regulator [Anaerolineae bacterium]|nr:FMN-binding negative transcriptional regulator [Anaerolineae bacterium]